MKNGLKFVDSDGHVYEHPARMIPELAAHAPKQWRDRILDNWGARDAVESLPSEQAEESVTSRLLNPMLRAGGHEAAPRLKDMDAEGIDISVLYPTSFLGIQH